MPWARSERTLPAWLASRLWRWPRPRRLPMRTTYAGGMSASFRGGGTTGGTSAVVASIKIKAVRRAGEAAGPHRKAYEPLDAGWMIPACVYFCVISILLTPSLQSATRLADVNDLI